MMAWGSEGAAIRGGACHDTNDLVSEQHRRAQD
jgi:hypothetical protein